MRLTFRSALAPSLILALACGGGPSDTPSSPPSSAPPTAATPAVSAPPSAPSPPAASSAAPNARPLYYDRALTDADLDGRTLRELALMRNTVFARQGHPFVKAWLDSYFRAQPWYTPSEKADLSKLTPYDRDNVARITKAEQAVTHAELIARRDAVRAETNPDAEDAIELHLISAALGEWSGSDDVPIARRNPLEDPNVLEGQLVLGQIEDLSRRDLRLLRNTIYARHGRPFKSAVLQTYFDDKAWYAAAATYSDASLTAVDKRNIQLVQSMEDRLGGPMREWEHQKEEGWFEGA